MRIASSSRGARPLGLPSLGAAAIAMALALAAATAAAQTGPPGSGSVAPIAPGGNSVRAYEVEGFRSAKFGASEAEVRRAIQVDFNIKDSAIGKETNPVERTTILTITANDVLPEAGPVRVYYIFGYTSKKLFQVVLNWGAGVSDTAPNAQNVLAGGQPLLNYFANQPFRPENRIVNAQLSDGTNLLFQGTDEKGRMLQLQYGFVTQQPREGEKREDGKAPPRIPFGRLVYVEDPKNPDIFRIKPGQF